MVTLNASAQPPALPGSVPPAPTDDRPVRRAGAAIILLAFGVFGSWAAMANLDSAAVAPGVVTVESYRKTVQHLEGGIVTEILVRDGDVVRAGDVLLRLDETQTRAQVEIVRGQHYAALAWEARLIAEHDQLEEIAFPQALLAAAHDPRVQDTLNVQRQVFEARRAALEGEISVLEQRIEQLNEQIHGLEALQQSKQKRILSYQEELRDLHKMLEKKFVEAARVRPLERDLAELEGERAEHLAAIASAKVQIGEARLQIIQRKQEMQREVTEQLWEVQTQIHDLEERLGALEDTLSRKRVTAPVDGAVVGMDIHTVGGVVAPGAKILDIVPLDERLIVEAHVQPQDIDKVHPGLEAEVRFTAFKMRTTPVVDGAVVTVSADRLTDPVTNMPYYLARISVSPEEMARLDGLSLIPGMPADVMIKTGERTMLNYLVSPLKDAVARAFREE